MSKYSLSSKPSAHEHLGLQMLLNGAGAFGLRLATFAQGVLWAAVWAVGLVIADVVAGLMRLFPRPPTIAPQTDSEAPFISVIIPSFNGRELLDESLPALRRAFERHVYEHEVIVVDDGSTDRTIDYLQSRWPQVRLVRHPTNLGFIRACNDGAAAARGTHLLFLNNDMLVDADFLPPLLEGFADAEVAAVSSHIHFAGRGRRRQESGLTVGRLEHGRFDVWHRFLSSRTPPAELPCLYAGGGSTLFSRRAFSELGGFDSLFEPFYYEDVDLSYRAWQGGWRVQFASRSIVVHHHRSTIGRFYDADAIAAIMAQNKQLFVFKNVRSWRHLLFALLRLPFGQESDGAAMAAYARGSRRAVARLAPTLKRRVTSARSVSKADAAVFAASAQPRVPSDLWSCNDEPGGAPRILILTPHFPFPLRHGGAVRMYHYIRCLAERGYRISLLSFIEVDEERAHREALTPFCEHVELIHRRRAFQGDVWNLHPFADYFDLAMVEAIRVAQSSRQYDIVQCEYTNMGIYAPYISPPARKLLVEIDISFVTLWRRFVANRRLWRAAGRFIDAAATFRAELELCRQFDHIVTMSHADAEQLQQFGRRFPEISVVPNGVSLADHPLRRSAEAKPALLFVGYFLHPPNVEGILHFARHVWPLLRAARPELRLEIAGAMPPPEVEQLARQPGVSVHGYVENLDRYYEECALFVAPLIRGSGTRLKILEAMARGIPVVASLVACEGLEVENGREVWMEDEPQRMAERIARALDDPQERRELALRARQFVEARYDYPALTDRYEEVYARLLGRPIEVNRRASRDFANERE